MVALGKHVRLKPWQAYGAVWLAERRYALLADEMRVGKTLTALTAAQLIRARRILVICPAFARHNWEKEAERAVPGIPRHIIKTKKQLESVDGHDPGVYVTSYGLIPKAEATPWDVVIADESHFLRSCSASRTRQVLGKGGLVHRTRAFWALSGTPAVGNYSELWALLHVFGTYAGSYERFCRDFCTMHLVRDKWVPSGSKNAEALRVLLEPVMLRRRFAEVAPEQAAIEYSDYVLDIELDFVVSDSAVLRRALSRRDLAEALSEVSDSVSTLHRLLGVAKVPASVELLSSELDAGDHKLVVFAVHRDVVALLAEGLAGYNPAVINGLVSAANRDAALARFQQDPMCRVFIGNIASAGTAIDLSVANEVVFVEASWVPGENQQAAMRLQNMNRTGGISARFLSSNDWMDRRITHALARKASDLTAIFD